MSHPFFSFRGPFDVVRHPEFEPEVKRAILASWASDAVASPNRPALRHLPEVRRAVSVDEVLGSLQSLDDDQEAQLG